MTSIGSDIDHAVKLLTSGEIIGLPTETVYGLAGNAFNSSAVAKIFKAKQRPFFDPLIVHTGGLEQIDDFVSTVPDKAMELAKSFWPGPLTLLLPKKSIVPDLVTSGLTNVAIRVPNHPTAQNLLKKLTFPLAAPSANPFGYISPTTAQHVLDQLGQEVSYVLDGGMCKVGLESTIVGFEKETPIIYRLGGITLDAIQDVIGKVEVTIHSSSNPAAPGQLKRHYSPRKKLVLGDINHLIDQYKGHKIGILSFDKNYDSIPSQYQFILSPSGDMHEAAQNLFSTLRALDTLPVDIIIASLLPSQGLGLAINDRLKRAAAE